MRLTHILVGEHRSTGSQPAWRHGAGRTAPGWERP
jgi:hypothetical protein